MAEEQRSLKFLIELLAKNQGAIEAAAAISKVGKEAETTKKTLFGMSTASKELSGHLLSMVGGLAAARFAFSSLKEFATLERTLKAVALQMDAMGISSAKEMPRVLAFVQALQDSGDGLMTQTVPAFQRFLGLTGSVAASMSMVELASRIAESGQTDLAGAAQALTNVLAGRVGPALKELGVNLHQAGEGQIKASRGLELLNQHFPEAIKNIEDTQDALDKLEAIWTNFKMSVATLVVSVVTGWGEIAAGAIGMAKIVGAALDPRTLLDPAKKEAAILAAWNGMLVRLEEISTGKSAEIGKASGDAFAKGLKEAGEVADRKKSDEDAKHDAEEAEKRLKRQGEEASKTLDATLKAATAEAQSRADLAARGSELELDLRLKVLDRQHDEAIAAAQREGIDLDAIDRTFLNARAKLQADYQKQIQDEQAAGMSREMDDAVRRTEIDDELLREALQRYRQEEDAALELLRVRLETEQLTLDKRMEIEKEIARIELRRKLAESKNEKEKEKILEAGSRKEIALEKMTSKQKVALSLQTAQAVVGALEGVFGESKATAVAQAIISTWLAVVNALAQVPYPANIAVAAAVAAMGLANVRKIVQTDRKKGAFDDPVNDRLALMGGRRSVEDFIRLSQEGQLQGWREVLAEARRSSAPARAGGGEAPINIHGNVYGGPAGMRELRRKIDRARRLDRPRFTQ